MTAVSLVPAFAATPLHEAALELAATGTNARAVARATGATRSQAYSALADLVLVGRADHVDGAFVARGQR